MPTLRVSNTKCIQIARNCTKNVEQMGLSMNNILIIVYRLN